MIFRKLIRIRKKSFWFKMKSFCFFKNVVKRNSKEKLYDVPQWHEALFFSKTLNFGMVAVKFGWKRITLLMWKKISKKFHFFFFFKSPEFWSRCEPISVKKNKTPSVVTVGLGWPAASRESTRQSRNENFCGLCNASEQIFTKLSIAM